MEYRFSCRKRDSIRQACTVRDFNALVSYATSEGGLLDDELRRAASFHATGPILLGSDHLMKHQGERTSPWDLRRHPDEDQVQLDVNRSFVYYPDCTIKELEGKKQELLVLIMGVLRRHPMLCYFQGYHDIAQVLFLVLGPQLAGPALTQISFFRIRDYMLPSLSPALKHLELIPPILERADPKLRRHLSDIQPFFALPAALTLYAHSVEKYSNITRIYDFLLSYEPVVSIYLFATIILSQKEELLEIPTDEPEMLHFALSKLPLPSNLEGLIGDTVQLFRTHPPGSLPFRAWQRISQYSALKTSQDLSVHSAVKEAEVFFTLQTRGLQREEFRRNALKSVWRYRKSAGLVGLTIFAGILSFWIRKYGLDGSIWSYLAKFEMTFRYRR